MIWHRLHLLEMVMKKQLRSQSVISKFTLIIRYTVFRLAL